MWKKAILLLAVTVISYRLFDIAIALGMFQNTYNHAPGPCHRLQGIEYGAEDIEVLPNGLAFISSGLRMKFSKGDYSSQQGQIFLFDFNEPNTVPQPLTIDWGGQQKTIIPHGISIWTNAKTGAIYLYVIVHEPSGEAVDKYLFNKEAKTLKHLRRIENQSNFHQMINDLKVVAEDKFYYTNYLYINDAVEIGLNVRWGSVGFFDGNEAKIVEKNLMMPNGINTSPDGKYLYLAHIGDRELRVYERSKDNNITFLQSTKLFSMVDNVDVEKTTGDIWIGSHPVGFKTMQYMENPKNLSPSQVFRLKITNGKVTDVREVYANNGEEISGSSVGVRYKKGMLVGSITTNCIYCQITNDI